MNRFKRCLIAAAAAGFAVMLVAGCGGGSGKSDSSAASGKASINIVQVKSEKEADLVDQAKKEGVVKVYSITVRIWLSVRTPVVCMENFWQAAILKITFLQT